MVKVAAALRHASCCCCGGPAALIPHHATTLPFCGVEPLHACIGPQGRTKSIPPPSQACTTLDAVRGRCDIGSRRWGNIHLHIYSMSTILYWGVIARLSILPERGAANSQLGAG